MAAHKHARLGHTAQGVHAGVDNFPMSQEEESAQKP